MFQEAFTGECDGFSLFSFSLDLFLLMCKREEFCGCDIWELVVSHAFICSPCLCDCFWLPLHCILGFLWEAFQVSEIEVSSSAPHWSSCFHYWPAFFLAAWIDSVFPLEARCFRWKKNHILVIKLHLFLQPQPSFSSLSTQETDSILPHPSPAQDAGAILQPCISLISVVFWSKENTQPLLHPYTIFFWWSRCVFPYWSLCAQSTGGKSVALLLIPCPLFSEPLCLASVGPWQMAAQFASAFKSRDTSISQAEWKVDTGILWHISMLKWRSPN